PDAPAATLGFVQITGGGTGQLHPAGGVIDTNVVFAGVASLKVAPVAATDPVLVTTCVYVMLLPANTGFGDAAFVTDRSAPAVTPTTVLTVAVLFAGLASLADELTDAVAVITVP